MTTLPSNNPAMTRIAAAMRVDPNTLVAGLRSATSNMLPVRAHDIIGRALTALEAANEGSNLGSIALASRSAAQIFLAHGCGRQADSLYAIADALERPVTSSLR